MRHLHILVLFLALAGLAQAQSGLPLHNPRLTGTANVDALTNKPAVRDGLDLLEPRRGLSKLYAKVVAGQTLSIMTAGNSLEDNARDHYLSGVRGTFGLAGLGLGYTIPAPYDGAASTIDTTLWPTGAIYTLPAGGRLEFQTAEFYPAAVADKAQIYYVQQPGGGTFKVQTSVDGAAYADESGLTAVSASGTLTGQIITLTKPVGTYLRVRVIGVSGTTRIIGGGAWRTDIPGAVLSTIARGGYSLGSNIDSSSAVVVPILAAIAPDLVIFGQGQTVETFTAMWPTFRAFFPAATDFILNGGHPMEGIEAATQAGNRWLRDYAAANGHVFFDPFPLFESYAKALANGYMLDPIHLNTKGDEMRVSRLFEETGLNAYSVTRRGSMFDGAALRSPLDVRPDYDNTFYARTFLRLRHKIGSPDGTQFSIRNDKAEAEYWKMAFLDSPGFGGMLTYYWNGGPYYKVDGYGLQSLGRQAPTPSLTSEVEIHGLNGVPGLGLHTPGTTPFLQFRHATNGLLTTVASDGGWEGPLRPTSTVTAADVEITNATKGYILKSTTPASTKRFRLSVDDAGVVTATEIP